MWRRILYLSIFSVVALSSCSEYEICGKAGAPNCCAIKYGEDSTVSYCVPECADCIKAASESGGAPSCPAEESGWKDTYTHDGCLTGKRKKNIFKADAGSLHELPYSPVIKVKMTDDPLDCAAICSDQDGGSCASAKVVPETSRQLLEFKERLATANGEIPVSEIHDTFGIMTSADTCRRKGLFISGGRIENNGPFDCDIETTFSIGAKEIPLTLTISRNLSGEISRNSGMISVRFTDDEKTGTILIGDELLNSKYGGPVTNVDVIGRSAYFSTPNSCIALSLE